MEATHSQGQPAKINSFLLWWYAAPTFLELTLNSGHILQIMPLINVNTFRVRLICLGDIFQILIHCNSGPHKVVSAMSILAHFICMLNFPRQEWNMQRNNLSYSKVFAARPLGVSRTSSKAPSGDRRMCCVCLEGRTECGKNTGERSISGHVL